MSLSAPQPRSFSKTPVFNRRPHTWPRKAARPSADRTRTNLRGRFVIVRAQEHTGSGISKLPSPAARLTPTRGLELPAVDITVAFIGHAESPFTEPAGDDWKRPYGERRKVVIDASPQTPFSDVLESAASALSLEPPEGHHFKRFSASHNRVAFYKPDDDHGIARDVWALGELAVLDRYGHAVFGVHDNRTITIDQLIRTANAGLLDGDPLHPYLIIESPYGDAPPIDLATFRQALDVLWDVVSAVSTAGGAIAFGKYVLDGVRHRLAAARQGLNGEWPDLAQRLQRPDQLWRVVLQRPWTTEELAQVLDCRPEHVDALLTGSGLDKDDQGLWRVAEGEDARLLYELLTVVNHTEKIGPDRFVDATREVAEALLRTGSIPQRVTDEESFWGAGAVRRTMAMERGESTDLQYLRAFCQTTSRPDTAALMDLLDKTAGVEVGRVEVDGRPWRTATFHLDESAYIRVSVDLDNGDPDGMFATELMEFADDVALGMNPLRHAVLQSLYQSRMIAVVELASTSTEEAQRAAVSLISAIAQHANGILHEDPPGRWWLNGEPIEL
jgi:hypothetical protein